MRLQRPPSQALYGVAPVNMKDSTSEGYDRRIAAAVARIPKPGVLLAIAGATLLVGAVAIVPINDAGAKMTDASQKPGFEQTFALASVAGKAKSAIAERDVLGSDLSPADTIAALAASHDQNAWAKIVLYYGGWEITDEKVAAITQWMRAENYPESWWLRNNPLNNGWYTSTGNYMGSYSSLDQAAYYAADSIRNRGLYPGIAAALDDGSASASTVASAIINSGWATGFYGGGSHWHTGDVPGYAAPAGAWGY